MTRTTHETSTEKWLDSLDPASAKARDASGFREIVEAKAQLASAEAELRRVVKAAHDNGDSWTVIGAALGVSRQTAWERFKDA